MPSPALADRESIALLGRGEDFIKVNRAEDVDAVGSGGQALGAQAHLFGRFLAGDVEYLDAGLGQLVTDLQRER